MQRACHSLSTFAVAAATTCLSFSNFWMASFILVALDIPRAQWSSYQLCCVVGSELQHTLAQCAAGVHIFFWLLRCGVTRARVVPKGCVRSLSRLLATKLVRINWAFWIA